jgi:hypothetical protein
MRPRSCPAGPFLAAGDERLLGEGEFQKTDSSKKSGRGLGEGRSVGACRPTSGLA